MRLPLGQEERAALAEGLAAAVRQEYPHKLDQELRADTSLLPPRELNPSFYGSYDWHSAVHCHWALVRLLDRGLPDVSAARAADALDAHLSGDRLGAELAFFAGPDGRTSERPYGWAWLILLHAELTRLAVGGREELAGDAARWAEALGPLAEHLRRQLVRYLTTTLVFPIRSGTHANTAFSLSLLAHAARVSGDDSLRGVVADAVQRWFLRDTLPWFAPPSGGDFLDPNLTAAVIVAEVSSSDDLAAWLRRSGAGASLRWAEPPDFRPDGDDPGTVHLEGLLLSKAWSLHLLERMLPAGDAFARTVRASLGPHLALIEGANPADGFNRAHWVPTFVVYLDDELRTRAARTARGRPGSPFEP